MLPDVLPPTDDDAIALLTEMVTLYSPSGEEQVVAQHLVATLTRWGLEAHVDVVGNAVARVSAGGEAAPRLIMLGHMDTAPGQTAVRREGAMLYGRGSVDAKGPLAAFAVALARYAAQRDARGLDVTLVGAVEEECATSRGAYHVADTHPRPDYAIIGEPSAWNRITIGYKGRLLVDYALERAMSHTAGQERGACEEAVEFWQHIKRWAEDYNRDKEARFDTLDPSLRHIASDSDGLRERVEMSIGLRLPLALDLPRLLEAIESWRGAAHVRTWAHELPYRAAKNTPLTSAFLAGIRAELRARGASSSPAFVTKTGTADFNVLGPRWQVPILAYGPGDSALDHTPDEHLDLHEYLAAIRVLTGVLQRLGTSSG